MKVRRGLRDSFENLFHEVAKTRDEKNFLFIPNDVPEFSQLKLLERYIGVIYRPQTEKASHYSVSCMGKEFDAICFFDFSNALEPIVLGSIWKRQSEKFGIPMELAIDIYPESPEIRNIASGKAIDIAMQLHKLGQVYMQNDYAEIALEKFTKGLKYSEHPEVPKSLKVELLLHSASCHLKIKAWTKAIRNCDEILKFDDKNTLAIQLKTQALAEITLGSK